MDSSGFSSPSVRTTENNPRPRLTAESLPSLSQLRLLYEEAVQEETASPPEEEPAAEPDEPAATFAAPSLRADIPSLSQLTALRSESAQQQERRQAAIAYEYARRAKAAEQPARRSAAVSAVTPRQKKPAARYVRAVPVQPKREAAPQERTLQRAVVQPAPAESRPEPAAEPRRVLTAQDLPTLSQLSLLREEAQADSMLSGLRTEAQTVSRAPAARPADLPSVEALRELRSDAVREPAQRRAEAPPAPQEAEKPAFRRNTSAESRLDILPTLEQLKAQLEEENLYGNLAFQDSVRQIKQVLTEPAPAAEQKASAQKTQAERPAPQRSADSPQKVGYISYEEFLKEEEFDDFSSAGSKLDVPARKDKGKNAAARADAPAQKSRFSQTEPARPEGEGESPKKKRNQKIHIWMNSLLRSN